MPVYSGNPLPDNFAPLLKSKSFRDSPNAIWVLGVNEKSGLCPHSLTSMFWDSSLPFGTLECGALGILRRALLNSFLKTFNSFSTFFR